MKYSYERIDRFRKSIENVLAKKYDCLFTLGNIKVFKNKSGRIFVIDVCCMFGGVITCVHYAESLEWAREGVFMEDGQIIFTEKLNTDHALDSVLRDIEEHESYDN